MGLRPDEELSNDDLIAERYQGIRPAPGYPACPDHTEKGPMFELLDAEARAGITLTESFAMLPGASVSGYYFWHPEANYFGLGRIGRDQLEDYARRKGMPVEDHGALAGTEPRRGMTAMIGWPRPTPVIRTVRLLRRTGASVSGVYGSRAAMTWAVPRAACAARPAAMTRPGVPQRTSVRLDRRCSRPRSW